MEPKLWKTITEGGVWKDEPKAASALADGSLALGSAYELSKDPKKNRQEFPTPLKKAQKCGRGSQWLETREYDVDNVKHIFPTTKRPQQVLWHQGHVKQTQKVWWLAGTCLPWHPFLIVLLCPPSWGSYPLQTAFLWFPSHLVSLTRGDEGRTWGKRKKELRKLLSHIASDNISSKHWVYFKTSAPNREATLMQPLNSDDTASSLIPLP